MYYQINAFKTGEKRRRKILPPPWHMCIGNDPYNHDDLPSTVLARNDILLG
jgi:hypothetical protein